MEATSSPTPPQDAKVASPVAVRLPAAALYLNVFIVATCGLVYELLAGTLGSYLLGDSVTQFSLVIGLYLSAMGVGAWLSKSLDQALARRFLEVELAVAVVGGFSAPVLFTLFGLTEQFQIVLLGFVFVIGVLVGLEIPLLMRLLEGQMSFKNIVSRVLTFDYLGALMAALLFPLLFVPRLGLVRTSLLLGMANALVALWGTWLLSPLLGRSRYAVRVRAAVVLVALIAAFTQAGRWARWAEEQMFADDVVYAESTPYQRIVVTRARSGFNLFLNGNLQFAAADEYRYHEALVHPAMLASPVRRKVLILGGGDGLAAREVLRYPEVEAVTLVDLDPAMTRLARQFAPFVELNHGSLDDPRMRVINEDAWVWLREQTNRWDVAIVDFPDPNSLALGKLYTRAFYRRLAERLEPQGAMVVQATSPLFARRSFWCIVSTMEAAGLHVRPFQTAVPSFGVWGFAMAKKQDFLVPQQAPPFALRFLDTASLQAMFALSADMSRVPTEINTLDQQALVRYYENEWRHWQ